MIDALFGSKTRVKLLYLFLNNPGKSFYVREITRLIDEQINSVRRELSNMLYVGIITSDTADNKLYYGVNQKYKYYEPLCAIFSDQYRDNKGDKDRSISWKNLIKDLKGAKFVALAGSLVKGSASAVDIVIVGTVVPSQLNDIIKQIERIESRELNYTVLSYDEFYYRLSVRDRFIMDILDGRHIVLIDEEKILKTEEGGGNNA